MKRKIIWGYTCYGPHRIKIWKSFVNSQYDGLTWNRKSGFGIEINSECFEMPALLDETLIHEFVHIIEYFHGLQWEHMCKADDATCCPAVKAIGHGLAQMLRELVQL